MEGYPKIAQLMNQHGELAIFRKFGSMNMQNLLYLQAELTYLESDYQRLAMQDEACAERPYRSRDLWSLKQPDRDGTTKQWDKFLEIREKLKEYNDQLYKQAFLSNLSKLNPYDLEFFRDWLQRPKMGNFPLRGLDRNSWSETYEADLISIHSREAGDPLSNWFINKVIPFFHNFIGHRIKKPLPEDPEAGISLYPDPHLLRFLDVISNVIASLLPLSSIVALYFVPSMTARLGIVAGFTAAFSLCLTLVTQARRIDIFSATSAFAAVLVVFLSSYSGNVA